MDKKSDADIRRGECGVTQGHLRSLRPNLRSSGRAFRISTLGFAAGIHGCQQCVAGNPGGLFRAGKRQDILLGALAVTMQLQKQIFYLTLKRSRNFKLLRAHGAFMRCVSGGKEDVSIGRISPRAQRR
jgi:hypothetical protein